MLQRFWLTTCLLIFYIQHSSRGTPLTGVGVRNAKIKEFPFVVSIGWSYFKIILYGKKSFICGGTLITPKHVLTAAHCFTRHMLPDDIVVRVNNADWLGSKIIYKVKKWTTFDAWANNEDVDESKNDSFNDIAILELISCVNSRVKPAIITKSSRAQLYGKKAIIAGWDLVEKDGKPRFLLTGKVEVLNPDECLHNLKKNIIGRINDTAQTLMCSTADPPVYTQCGDSGSPLFLNPNEIIAVNKGQCTRTRRAKELEKQNIHTSIDHYRKFITEVIKFKVQGCCVLQ